MEIVVTEVDLEDVAMVAAGVAVVVAVVADVVVVAVVVGELVVTTTDKVLKDAKAISTVHTIKADKSVVNKTHVSDQDVKKDLLTTM